MSLNEVNWRNVLEDKNSFPPDVEFIVTEGINDTGTLPQNFLCHKLLLAAVSPVFQNQFFANYSVGMFNDRMIVRVPNCNPRAFQKMLEFIYYQKPYRLNSSKQVEGIEGIKLVMDTMDLAIRFKLTKLVTFCEETAAKTIIVNSKNYSEIQKLMMNYKELGMIHQGLREKFGSLVSTRLARDRPDLDYQSKREIVESEIVKFGGGLPSHIMTNKRNLFQDHLVARRDSPQVKVPHVNKAARLEDVVILRTAPNNNEPDIRMHSVPVASGSTTGFGGSTSSRISCRTNLTSLISPLEPFLSPVPTSSLQSEPDSSPNLGSLLSFLGQGSSSVTRLALSESWKPLSTSTPAPSLIDDEEGVPPVDLAVHQVSDKQNFQNIKKFVAEASTVDETSDEVITKDELISLATRFKDLCEDEKKELLEYVKSLEVKNPQLVKSVRSEVMRNLGKL